MELQRIIQEVKRQMNGPVSQSLSELGIEYKVNYGVSIPELQSIAKDYTGNHELALSLYEQDIRECKLLASMIDDPKLVTGEQIDNWAQSFTNHEIVEQVCSNLLWKTDCALSRSIEWCLTDNEFLQKAGLIIAARSASDINVKDIVFEPYLEIIEGFESETFSAQKVSIEFALRQIAKRNTLFKQKVLAIAKALTNSSDEHKAWVGSQILFEFEEDNE